MKAQLLCLPSRASVNLWTYSVIVLAVLNIFQYKSMKPPRTYPSLKRLAKAWKQPPFFDQGPVIARLHDLPLPQHDNPVSVPDNGNTVGENGTILTD